MNRLIRMLTRVYRQALVVYSRRFRNEYGDEMARAFEVKLVRAHGQRGLAGAFACLSSALLDLAINAPSQRLEGRRRRSRVPGRPLPASKGDRMPTRILRNLRYAARTLARQPGLAVTVILVLAIGSAATISIFSIVDAALVRPLPYPEAGRLTSIVQTSESFGTYPFAVPFLDDLRGRVRSLDSLVGLSPSWDMTMTGAGEPRQVTAAYVSEGLFALLDASLREGRLFEPGEYLEGGPQVTVVSRSLWQRHFGEGTPLDAQIVDLSGEPHVIVGIIDSVQMPITTSTVASNRNTAELWLPFAGNPFAAARNIPVMNVFGRLAAGVSLPQAESELEEIRTALIREFPDAGLGSRWTALPLAELVAQESRTTVLLLLAAAGLLLLIACANAANLMLARATRRSHETSIRASLGASTSRLIEQGLTESLLVAAVGCGAGLLLAAWVLRIVPALGLQGLPPSAVIRIDARVALFTMALACITAVLFGTIPALYSSRLAALGRLRTTPRGGAGGSRAARNALVVAEVALALVLLVGAGLLARSFVRLTQVDPGFRSRGLIAVPLGMSGAGYATSEDRRLFLGDLLEQYRSVPGVDAAAAVNRLPLGGGNVFVGVEVEGQPPDENAPPSDRRVVTPGYFDAVGIPILEGRDFDARDAADAEVRATIVNVQAARRFWPEQDPLGRRIRLMLRGGPGPWMTVVGVIGGVRHHALDQPAEPEVYVPYAQASVESMVAVLHGPDDIGSVIPVVKERTWTLNDSLALDGIVSIEQVVAGSVSEPRFRMLILGTFASLALLLSAVGVTAVISFSVAQRTRDIGVRMALGAQRTEILATTLREGLVLGAIGVAIGLVASLAASRVLEALLFEVTPTDPLTFAGVTVALLLIVAAASYFPARRATAVDPVEALRAE